MSCANCRCEPQAQVSGLGEPELALLLARLRSLHDRAFDVSARFSGFLGRAFGPAVGELMGSSPGAPGCGVLLELEDMVDRIEVVIGRMHEDADRIERIA